MATIERAVEALEETERRLRDLVGQAAAGGEYDAVDRMTDAARAIGTIARTWRNGKRLEHDPAAPSAELDALVHAGTPVADRQTPATTRRRARAPGRRSKRTPAKGEYPKFFRRNDNLVKIGWSRKARAEYEHKAPRRVLDALAAAVAKCSADGRVFTAEDLFPLKDPHDGSEIPGYQAYVALAWFKSAGLVKQHGRSGYSVRNGSRLPDGVIASWQKLPEKRAQG